MNRKREIFSVAMFTFGLNSFSGAAFQARLLSTYIHGGRIVILDSSDNNNLIYPSRARLTEDLDVVYLPRFVPLRFIFSGIEVIRRRVRIFHLHGFVKLALILGFLLGKKLILKTTMLGGDDFSTQMTYKFPAVRKYLIGNIDLNIALTKKIRDKNSIYLAESKIEVMPNAIEVRSSEFSKKESNTFCFVGVVCERKRPHLAIDFFIRFLADLPNAKLYIVGPLPGDGLSEEAETSYLQHCKALIPELRKHQVIFSGYSDQSQVSQILAKSKALLFFSTREGFPNVILEALRENCVPIISEMGGVASEMIEDGVNGIILPDDFVGFDSSGVSIVEKMIEARAPMRWAEENYDVKVISKKYADIYKSMER